MQRVALLGTGIMGAGMAANWLAKGFPLTVYNRTRSKSEPFVEQGAAVADTPREAAAAADVIFAMVGDDNSSRSVWLGEDGALAGAKAEAVIVESSTLTPDWIRELAQTASEHNVGFLDAPVTGSKAAAAQGTLALFVGGDAATLEKARPALEAISRQINHLGPIGAGATWKLINNMMGAVHMAALAEGLVMAEKAGLDMEQVVNLIQNSGVHSGIVQLKLARAAERRYDDTDFALRWMHKDARYALALAEQFGLTLNTVGGAEKIYQQASDKGFGDLDFAAVVEAMRDSEG
ncbi:MAG: NAD(P)-dependent oxidoreductase [Burkholderiales bacterium]|nr:NAD(P)-dependent oxidoreductase [Anaerolineae bacterium]